MLAYKDTPSCLARIQAIKNTLVPARVVAREDLHIGVVIERKAEGVGIVRGSIAAAEAPVVKVHIVRRTGRKNLLRGRRMRPE
jgi:hypothetical protein